MSGVLIEGKLCGLAVASPHVHGNKEVARNGLQKFACSACEVTSQIGDDGEHGTSTCPSLQSFPGLKNVMGRMSVW